MLQGNPFEVELAVGENTKRVRYAVEKQRLSAGTGSRRELQQWWRVRIPPVNIRTLGEYSLEVARDGWWLPAGIAISILVGIALGL